MTAFNAAAFVRQALDSHAGDKPAAAQLRAAIGQVGNIIGAFRWP